MTRNELNALKEKIQANKNKAERFSSIKSLIEELPTVPSLSQLKDFLTNLKEVIKQEQNN